MQLSRSYKNHLTLIIVAILIGEVLFFNVLRNLVSIDVGLVDYWFLLSFYFLVTIILFVEKDHLEEFHIDRFSIILLLVFGSILHRRILAPHEMIFVILLWGVSGVLLFFLMKNWKRLTHNNFIELVTAALITIVLVFLMNYIDNSLISGPTVGGERSTLYRFGRQFIYNLSFVAPPEEFLFRGLFWGTLVRLGLSEKKAIIIQGIVFWLLHFQTGNAFRFFLLIPTATILYSILIVKYKRLFPAIMAHAFSNAILPIV